MQASARLENDEWTCRAATTREEAINLIEGGFQYVTDIDGTKLQETKITHVRKGRGSSGRISVQP